MRDVQIFSLACGWRFHPVNSIFRKEKCFIFINCLTQVTLWFYI